MEEKLSTLVNELLVLGDTITHAQIQDKGFDEVYGWNHIHLQKKHIADLVSGLIEKIDSYGSNPISEELNSSLDAYTQNIRRLNIVAKNNFTNIQPANVAQLNTALLLTILVTINKIEHELFSWDNLNDKELLPKKILTKIRSTNEQVNQITGFCENLGNKISIINDAHDAAESLPTDLANLREARSELTKALNDSRLELNSAKKDIDKIKNEIFEIKNSSSQANKEALTLKDKIKDYETEAKELISQCDDALQITTTQGLAAGFDQKAKELRESIRIWIAGLLIALISGAIIGADRVDAFTGALSGQLTPGQAMLHTIISIFSIGGPLWLAWISTQQINQRFKLSEDYSYKATIAKSFTGFSRLAERFDPATEQRLFNSTLDRFDEMPLRLIEHKDYNSPWHEFIDSEAFKKALDMVPTLAREAGRFANKAKLKDKPKESPKEITGEESDQGASKPTEQVN